jgi:DnaJ like chaperone protein
MSWWGKLLGGTFGFMLGGPLGALIGAALGHNFDAKLNRFSTTGGYRADHERVQTAFFTATFSVMGHIAKADGQVSQDEIRMAQAVMSHMRLNPALKKLAQNLFTQGKQPDFVLDDVLDQFKRECRHSHVLLRIFLEILIQAAYADGVLHPAEKKILLHICDFLGFTHDEFVSLESLIRGGGYYRTSGGAGYQAPPSHTDLKRAYQILNVTPEASDDEVKKSYRKLMNQHHPDKLVAKGLPEEMMKMAAEKTHEIKSAYELIKKARGS